MRKLPDHWKRLSLREATSFLKDGTHFSPKSTSGPFRYITSKNIRTGRLDLSDCQYISADEHSNIFSTCPVEFGDVLLTKDGASVGNVCRNTLTEPFSLLSSVAVLRGKSEFLDNEYLLQFLMSPIGQSAVLNEVAGQAITRITMTTLASLQIHLPPIEEQNAITSVLSTWDRGIRQLSDLIAAKLCFKQGLMQQLLTGKRRFPGYARSSEGHHTPCGELPCDWKTVPLSRVTRELKRKNDEGVTRVLTASGTRGLVDQRDFFNRKVAGEALDKYYLLKRGEFAYNRSLMKGYPYGATKRLDDYESGVLSTLYLCFQLASDACNSDYLVLLFECGLLNSQLRGIARMGARAHGLLNVTPEEFFDMVIPLPQLNEQQRIVDLFKAIDNELEILRRELDALKTQKKGLMQKLLTGQVRVKT